MNVAIPRRSPAVSVDSSAVLRRQRRLREELIDEGVPLPIEGPLGDVVLEELDRALHPEVHEGRAPRYGALVLDEDAELWPGAKVAPEVVDLHPDELAMGRRLVDGRASFLLRSGAERSQVVFFDRSLEFESSLVDLQRGSGALVIQRTVSGLVRAVSAQGIVTWDSLRWTFKPLAAHYVPLVRRLVPDADSAVLEGLLELCVHWLSAGRVGATLVWVLDEADPGPRPGFDLRPSEPSPPLSVARDEHFPALFNACAQLDRAVVVGAHGRVSHFGVGLLSTGESAQLIGPVGGTRHTSARRYSFDDPASVVFVVSQDGPVTVFRGGASAAELRVDPCRTSLAPPTPAESGASDACETRRCQRCDSRLLLDVVRFERWTGGPEVLPCPVCGHDLVVPVYRAVARGVVEGPGSGTDVTRHEVDPSWCPTSDTVATRPTLG